MSGKRDARQRILDATTDLVVGEGLAAATPAAIAERAGAGKMALYRHFAGKDELIAEALIQRDPIQRALLLGELSDLPARERVLSIFDRIADDADRLGADFVGCPYINARLVLSDDEHPAASAVATHKEAMTRELAGLLAEAGVANPERGARVALILIDGAIVHAVIQGSSKPLREARDALSELLDSL